MAPFSSDNCELTIFGKGFGESILLHFGNNDWIVIDSCLDSNKIPIPLIYLQNIGISPKQIKYIVATHWDTDHIRGLSKIYKEATEAYFVCSRAMKEKEFLKFVYGYGDTGKRKSSTSELVEILDQYDMRKKSDSSHKDLRLVGEFTTIEENEIVLNNKTIKRKITALSPSSAAQIKSLHDISKLIANNKMPLRNVRQLRPNHTSIVLLVEIGELRLLLGSDLEELGENDDGWKAIVCDNRMQNKESEIFKVPHHGSENGHNESVWTEYVADKNISLLTTFCHGKTKLPLETDIDRIKKYSSNIYVAGSTNVTKKKFDRDTTHMLRKLDKRKETFSLKRELGQITIKKPIIDGVDWKVEYEGAVLEFKL